MEFKEQYSLDTSAGKIFTSTDYNFIFDKKTGYFLRWGKNRKDDPEYSLGPEILDIEVTTICNGIPNQEGIESPCKFCYKSNTKNGKNMSVETFKKIFYKFDKRILTQVAFGVDAKAESNPDLWHMMDICRAEGIIPNLTVANINDDIAWKIVTHAGACAVSRYANKDICYNSVKRLTDNKMKQVNIHCMISEETFDIAFETLRDRLTDKRLEKLNAIVLLSLKQKGRGIRHTPLAFEKFKQLVYFALDNKIGIGFDSCGANKFIKVIENNPDKDKLIPMVEPCESSLFSSYVSVDGKFYPCSFAENTEGWKEGLDVLNCDNFIKDVWNHPRTLEFKKKLLNCHRNCPLFGV